jgi:hypothetical protein
LDYRFHTGDLPAGYQSNRTQFLFNSREHRLLQSPEGWVSYFILNERSNSVTASLYLHCSNGQGISPLKAPFGGVEVQGSGSPLALYHFFEYVEEDLREKGIPKLTLKNPPLAYGEQVTNIVSTVLLNRGYRVSQAEITAIISVEENFIENFHQGQKGKYKQAQEKFSFRSVPREELETVYRFIAECHREKGYSLSMSLEDLRRTAGKFPDQYLLFGVFQGETFVAASIAIRISDSILYNFYCDHDQQFDSFSPVVFLLAGMGQYCQREQIQFLDLGTSALEGKPNFSLLDFKLRLGGVPSSKFTLEKELEN